MGNGERGMKGNGEEGKSRVRVIFGDFSFAFCIC